MPKMWQANDSAKAPELVAANYSGMPLAPEGKRRPTGKDDMSEYEDWTPLKDTRKADRRERIATAALIGLLAGDSYVKEPTQNGTRLAVAIADSLIAELDRT